MISLYLMSSFIGFTSIFVILLFFQLWISAYYKRKNIKLPVLHIIAGFVFAYFLVTIFSITGIPSIQQLLSGPDLSEKINVIPFRYFSTNSTMYYQNILLFMPVGFFLPLLWASFRRLDKTVMLGFSLSLLIEISQLFNFRATDIDDLLMNTLGTLLGYLLFQAGKAILPKFINYFSAPKSSLPFVIKNEGSIYLGVITIAYLFLHSL